LRKRIVAFAAKNNLAYEEYETLKEAMASIKNNITRDDIVLLSPGAASWDQYAKFEDRGDEFKNIVNNY